MSGIVGLGRDGVPHNSGGFTPRGSRRQLRAVSIRLRLVTESERPGGDEESQEPAPDEPKGGPEEEPPPDPKYRTGPIRERADEWEEKEEGELGKDTG